MDPANHEHVGDDTDGPDVTLGIVASAIFFCFSSFAVNDLWRHIHESSLSFIQQVVLFVHTGCTEINELDEVDVAFVLEEHVLGLEISMDDAFLMHVSHC